MLGLTTDFLGRRTFLLRVTLLLAFGIIVGDEVLGVIPASVSSRFEIITDMALLMIGFLLGGKLTLASLTKAGSQLAWNSISAALGTTVIVTLALLTVGVALEIAILLDCIAAATAPAATFDTVLESGSKSPFSRLLLAIVALDDAWALFLFSLGLALVSLLNGMQGISASLLDAAYEICGALLLGAWVGARASHADKEVRHWMGLALMPQAGVAIGMALLACNRFPEYQQIILSIIISTTVFFELFGPVFTRMALKHTQRVRLSQPMS